MYVKLLSIDLVWHKRHTGSPVILLEKKSALSSQLLIINRQSNLKSGFTKRVTINWLVFTPNVCETHYSGSTKSVSWLLMPWFPASPGHQHPWYWLCRMGNYLSHLRKDFNYLCYASVVEWHQLLIHFYVSHRKFSKQRVDCLLQLPFKVHHKRHVPFR